MAVLELHARKPGMKTLISLAISVVFIYSGAAQLINLGEGFFWEIVTLIDIMLPGHWLEMRSLRHASGAVGELAKLMPDTAERIHHGDRTETVPVSALKNGAFSRCHYPDCVRLIEFPFGRFVGHFAFSEGRSASFLLACFVSGEQAL